VTNFIRSNSKSDLTKTKREFVCNPTTFAVFARFKKIIDDSIIPSILKLKKIKITSAIYKRTMGTNDVHGHHIQFHWTTRVEVVLYSVRREWPTDRYGNHSITPFLKEEEVCAARNRTREVL